MCSTQIQTTKTTTNNKTIFKPKQHDIHKHTNGRIRLEPNHQKSSTKPKKKAEKPFWKPKPKPSAWNTVFQSPNSN